MAAFDPIFGNLSGRVGANVWSRNAAGAYVRNGPKPVNTNTARRQQTKTAFQQSSDAWRDAVDQSGKTDWDAYSTNTTVTGKFGKERKRTGRGWFMAINSFLLNGAEPLQLAPPITPGVAKGYDVTVDGSVGGGIQVIADTGNLLVGDFLQFQLSAPFANTRNTLNAPLVETVFETGDNVVGLTLKPDTEVSEGQIYFVVVTLHDNEGKLQISPLEKRIEILP